MSFEVYNRWGKRVHSNSEDKDRELSQACFWDGTDMNSGEVLGDGVYFYIVNAQDDLTGTTESLKGQVNILKN